LSFVLIHICSEGSFPARWLVRTDANVTGTLDTLLAAVVSDLTGLSGALFPRKLVDIPIEVPVSLFSNLAKGCFARQWSEGTDRVLGSHWRLGIPAAVVPSAPA
jgi:hypothetical protein